MATALRLGASPDAGPALHVCSAECGRATMGTRASNLWRRTLSTRSPANTGEPGTDGTVRFNTPCAGSLSKQGATRTWSAMSLCSMVRNNSEAAPKVRCAILDVVSGPRRPATTLHRRQRAMSRAERYHESASKPGVAAVAGETEKRRVTVRPCETCGRLGGEGTKLMRDLVATAAANGKCSPPGVWTMEDPAGASAADLISRHILEGAGIQSCGASCC